MDTDTQLNLPKMIEGGLDVAWLVVYTAQGELNEKGYEAARDNAIAIIPDLKSSALTLGPTFSTLLKLKPGPTDLVKSSLIS